MRDALKAYSLAVLLFASAAAAAQEALPGVAQQAAADMKAPTVSSADVDWGAARAAIAGFDQLTARDDTAGVPAPDALVRLNAATEKIFPKIATSPVPVLLPFNTAAFLRDEADGKTGETAKYLSGFHASTFFYPGPSGYDAAFSLQPQDTPGLDLTFVKRVDVQISGSALVYELGGSTVVEGSPAAVPELENEFPGIRSMLLESRLRYSFVRFGLPYFVSIECFDGAARMRRLSCREASKVAVRFLKALDVVGGAPQGEPAKAAPQTTERPDNMSPDFTYYAPGDILPSTGVSGHGGRADSTVYSKIRFPIAQAPAYTNSQTFMNWGNCDLTGRVALGGHGKDATYRCRVNTVPLVEDETKNYAYPWRDNFCEHRSYYVTQCPAGLGHQGEDVRPGSCKLRNEGADRCEPYQHDVVAVRDGVALRAPGDEAFYLVVNRPGEHIRFRYLHMNPRMLDAAGMISGRALAEGEVLGRVGDYGAREGGTTYHLHFDVQVPTRHGWVFVNPYMTLVAAYERLIGGRGRLVSDATLASAANGAAAPSAERQTAALPADTDAMPEPNVSALAPPKPAETSNPPAPGAIVAPNVHAQRSAESTPKPKREPKSGAHSRAQDRASERDQE